jgi:hypothetical protein
MKYTKPEVAVLGDAVSVIEVTHAKQQPSDSDGIRLTTNAAYDLDE